jgi:hypothetical protein
MTRNMRGHGIWSCGSVLHERASLFVFLIFLLCCVVPMFFFCTSPTPLWWLVTGSGPGWRDDRAPHWSRFSYLFSSASSTPSPFLVCASLFTFTTPPSNLSLCSIAYSKPPNLSRLLRPTPVPALVFLFSFTNLKLLTSFKAKKD